MREIKHRHPCGRRYVWTAWIMMVALVPALHAERPEPPPFYAIQGARVVTGTGTTHDRATVVLAGGLIVAVAPDAEIPTDALVIDGTGLTVYPGLIEALGTLGQGRGEDSEGSGRGSSGGPGGDGPTIRGPEDRPKTTPWLRAADHLIDDDGRIAEWRAAGFTAALTSPDQGLFPGQATVINLGDSEPRERVVAPSVAQRVQFDTSGGFRTYPGSLMGAIGYVRQVLSDARHHGAALAQYEDDPSGRVRPRYDRTLMPLYSALEAGQPFIMPGVLPRHIDRVLALSEAQDLNAIVHGAHGAYARADALAAAGAAVIVDLEWPEASKDRDPDTDTPFRDLAHRRLAPATPARLHAAGVPFAFSAANLSGPGKAFEATRAAIAAGLAEDTALTAWTAGAARILGVDDRMGSVAVGQIANVILASAPPWDEDVEIAAVFVDGVRYTEPTDDEEHEPPAADVSGTWAVTLETPRGVRDMTAELEMDDDGKVTGELKSDRGDRTVEKGRMSGDRLSFKTTQTMGDRTVEASFSLVVEGEDASGAMSAGPMSMDLRARRTATSEAAQPSSESTADDVSLDEIEAALAVYQGPVRTWDANTTIAITNATIYPVSGPKIESGTVLINDGVITAVGADVAVPAGAEVIDAEGGSLIPGIVDAHSHIAIEGGGNEGALAVTSMVTIQDVIEPDDIAIYRALAGGVTTVNVLHGSANPIGGGNAVLKLRWGQDADGMRLAGAPPGIKFALGENPKRSRGGGGRGTPQRYPATRMGVMDVIDQAFTDAKAYQRSWDEFETAKEAGEDGLPPRRDWKLERLAEILSGERLVHAHSYRADEILQLLRLAESHGFRITTLQHVLEGYKVADEIAAHGAGASTFSDWWGYKVEAYDAIPHNAALMTERGVVVSINSDSSEEMRHLNQEAAKAMKWGGMSERDALALVTLNPAIHLGIDDRVGTIEVGKDADLTLYDGPPLSVFSVVQKTFVDGDLYFDLAADRDRQATIEALEARMAPDEGEAGSDDDGDSEDSENDNEEAPDHGWRAMGWDEFTTVCREDH